MAIDDADPDGHDEGGNYFVSMTDMMVGMLFIFIIMLMSFALMFRQTTDEHTTKIEVAEELARKLDELERQIDERLKEIREASEVRLALLNEIRSQLEKEQIKVEITDAGDVLRLPDDQASIKFGVNEWTLGAAARANVGKIAAVLARILPRYAACSPSGPAPGCRKEGQAAVETVFIEGHTDETGIDENNWALSAQRAASTYRELTAFAPELRAILNRRKEQILSISGYSSTRPVDAAHAAAAWAANRRIDLRFLMDSDTRAGLEEMQALLDEMRMTIDELKGP